MLETTVSKIATTRTLVMALVITTMMGRMAIQLKIKCTYDLTNQEISDCITDKNKVSLLEPIPNLILNLMTVIPHNPS